MKQLNKPSFNGLLTLFVLLAWSLQVSAQFESASDRGNLTQFTTGKKYTDITKLNELTPLSYRSNPDFGKCFNDSIQWVEQIDKRTLKTRNYVGPNGELITQNAYDNINYIDENGWFRAVNTKLQPYLNGWSSQQQEMPLYLYPDASTAISIGNNDLMIFNKNVKFNQQDISTGNYTVGDNGMYVKNATPGTDKIIRFGRGAIETDYTIKQPLHLNGDLVISEDIILPAGYTLSGNSIVSDDGSESGVIGVLNQEGKEVAELKTPLCYDNHHKNSITGTYQIQKQAEGYKLEIHVPSSWLNDVSRQYPVTIDPLVYGKRVYWTGGKIPSCFTPNYGTGSLTVTVPAGITITHFYVQGSWYCPIISKKYLTENFTTTCGEFGPVSVPDTTTLPGLAFGKFDGRVPLACCLKPLCTTQTVVVNMNITRDSGGTSCDSTIYGWYDPLYAALYDFEGDTGTFEVYVVGRTVQDSSWSISPTSICANECNINLNTVAYFGVPPYTVKHSWTTDTSSFGTHLGCIINHGTTTLALTIPNCPRRPCLDTTLSVPVSVITDACHNVVPSLSPLTLQLNPVPNVTATPDTETICSGTNVDLSLSSCLEGSTYNWMSSEGVSGTGNTINNSPSNSSANPITVNYTVTPVANGCTGNPTAFPVKVTPFIINISPLNPAICDGGSVNLSASGDATTYTWSPTAGLSCTSCNNPVANPTVTTTYVALGTAAGSCSAYDTVIVVVNPVPTLSVSKDTTIFVGASVHLLATTGGSTTVTWSPSAGLSSTSGDTIIATPTSTTTYTAVATEGPCTVSAQVVVVVNVSLVVPSAFTPNSGNENSRLYVLPNTKGLTLQQFNVYNRWGQQVFETNDITVGWDGTYNGKPQPMGTYVYYAKYIKDGQSTPLVIKGDVTLIR